MKENNSRNPARKRQVRETDPFYLRGYCRVCNRHYFFKNKLDTSYLQLHQHHGGICQNCNYACARIKIKTGDES